MMESVKTVMVGGNIRWDFDPFDESTLQLLRGQVEIRMVGDGRHYTIECESVGLINFSVRPATGAEQELAAQLEKYAA